MNREVRVDAAALRHVRDARATDAVGGAGRVMSTPSKLTRPALGRTTPTSAAASEALPPRRSHRVRRPRASRREPRTGRQPRQGLGLAVGDRELRRTASRGRAAGSAVVTSRSRGYAACTAGFGSDRRRRTSARSLHRKSSTVTFVGPARGTIATFVLDEHQRRCPPRRAGGAREHEGQLLGLVRVEPPTTVRRGRTTRGCARECPRDLDEAAGTQPDRGSRERTPPR